MKEREIETAKRFGVLDRIEALEKELLNIEHVAEVEFDLDCFWSDIRQVIILPKYDIDVRLENYYEVRREMLQKVLDVAKSFGLGPSGDRIEDYGEHYYIVRQCDNSWVLQRSPDVSLDSSVKEWYVATYPTDELGQELKDNITFEQAYEAVGLGSGFYDVIGESADSVVRERIFGKLAELYGVDYDVIYHKWIPAEPEMEQGPIDLSEYEVGYSRVDGFDIYRKVVKDENGVPVKGLWAAAKEGVAPFGITYAQAGGFVPIVAPEREKVESVDKVIRSAEDRSKETAKEEAVQDELVK